MAGYDQYYQKMASVVQAISVFLNYDQTKDYEFLGNYTFIALREGKKGESACRFPASKALKIDQELGGDYLERLDPGRMTRYHVKRLERLGHKVTLEPKAEAACEGIFWAANVMELAGRGCYVACHRRPRGRRPPWPRRAHDFKRPPIAGSARKKNLQSRLCGRLQGI